MDGVAASGDTGESDPLDAIQDALQTFPADRIVVFTRPDSEQSYREDVDPEQIEERFGVPVTVASVSGQAPYFPQPSRRRSDCALAGANPCQSLLK